MNRTFGTFIRITICALLLQFTVWGNPDNAFAGSISFNIGKYSLSKKNVKSLKDLKFKNMVRQTKEYSCGAAALSTIFTYYFGKEISESDVLAYILTNADKEKRDKIMTKGVSLLDLKHYGEELGYKGAGYKVPAHLLETLDRPAIALIRLRRYAHFIVVKAVRGENVHVADPSRGNMVLNLGDFLEMWNGILLVFSDPDGEKIETHQLMVEKDILDKNKLGLIAKQDYLGFMINPSEF